MGVIWITGLSGSGKTTLAKKIIEVDKASKWIHLDGDELRKILNKGTSFDKVSRISLAKQYSKIAKLLADQNHNVVVSTISLFNEIHKFNRENIQNYFEVYIECDIELLRERDDKNLYSFQKKNDLMGVSIDFDVPFNPNFIIKQSFDSSSLSKLATSILSELNLTRECDVFPHKY